MLGGFDTGRSLVIIIYVKLFWIYVPSHDDGSLPSEDIWLNVAASATGLEVYPPAVTFDKIVVCFAVDVWPLG